MSTHTPPPAWAVRTEADRRALAEGYYWDNDQAERILRFAEAYVAPKYTSSDWTLFEWQRRLLMSLYGWRSPDGTRRFTSAILHVGKKNGKTLLMSILAQFELFAAGVQSPLVVSASTTKENAGQVYDQMTASIKKQKKLMAIAKFQASEKRIRVEKRDGDYWAMSSDAPNAEGWNISFGIVDEAHAHRGEALFRALEHGTSGRASGFLVVISTAGNDFTHWYYRLLVRARKLLAGEDLDPTTYAEVHEPAEGADPEDPATWKAGNPSLDLYEGFTTRKFKLAWDKAKQDVAARLNFLRYRMNLFTRNEDSPWINLPLWDSCRADVPEHVLKGLPCWLGFDGSATTDPSSLSAVWLFPDRRYHVKSWAWVCEDGVRRREQSNLPKYRQFAAEGSMTITPGGMIDKGPIRQHVLAMREAGYQIRGIAMDINGGHIWGSELQAEGFEVHAFPQNFRWFTEPTREFATAVAGNRLTHDGSSWLRYCVHSVRLITDRDNNCRPAKSKSIDHIDGAIASLMPFRCAMESAAAPPPPTSSYDTHGIEFFD